MAERIISPEQSALDHQRRAAEAAMRLPRKFTKGALLEALKGTGMYGVAKGIYLADDDLQIAWAGFADIDLDYKATQDIMEKYPDFFNEENVQLLLTWIRDHQ